MAKSIEKTICVNRLHIFYPGTVAIKYVSSRTMLMMISLYNLTCPLYTRGFKKSNAIPLNKKKKIQYQIEIVFFFLL